MTIDALRRYCVAKIGAEETRPFGPDVIVTKVMGKMFALIPLEPDDGLPSISLKCDPSFALVLRENYAAVTAGYHLSKKHWNTVRCDESVPEDEIYSWIDDSYDLVVAKLTKKQRAALAERAD